MTIIFVTILLNIVLLLTTFTFYRKAKRLKDSFNMETTQQVHYIETFKKPIVIRDQFIYSKYHKDVIGEAYHNHIMRQGYERLIKYAADNELIEIHEEDIDKLDKRITLKLTIIK